MNGYEVAVLGNLRRNAPHREGEPADAWGDLDSESTMLALAEALEAGGHKAYFLEGDMSLPVQARPAATGYLFQHVRRTLWRRARSARAGPAGDDGHSLHRRARADAGIVPGQGHDQARAFDARHSDSAVPGVSQSTRAAKPKIEISALCQAEPRRQRHGRHAQVHRPRRSRAAHASSAHDRDLSARGARRAVHRGTRANLRTGGQREPARVSDSGN